MEQDVQESVLLDEWRSTYCCRRMDIWYHQIRLDRVCSLAVPIYFYSIFIYPRIQKNENRYTIQKWKDKIVLNGSSPSKLKVKRYEDIWTLNAQKLNAKTEAENTKNKYIDLSQLSVQRKSTLGNNIFTSNRSWNLKQLVYRYSLRSRRFTGQRYSWYWPYLLKYLN